MIRVLLDQNTSEHLGALLRNCHVDHARHLGWDRLKNGNLLRAAEEAGYTVMITADTDLYYQQNNAKRKMSLVLVSSTKWLRVQAAHEAILEAVLASVPGSFISVKV